MRHIAGIAWIFATILLAGAIWLHRGETHRFYGVAEASELIISVEAAADIADIRVTPGQAVQAGDTLVILQRPELALRLETLQRELDGSQGKVSLGQSAVDQEIAKVRADLESQRTPLLAEALRLEEQRNRNLEIAKRLKSLGSDTASNPTDALLTRIQSLRQQAKNLEVNANRQIALLQGNQGLQHDVGEAEKVSMQKELKMLRQQQAQLTIVATTESVVGSVNLHKGEKVQAFAPILTLAAHSPTLVRGYIPEKVYNSIQMDDSVSVSSETERGGVVHGRVVGVGSRIVELPLRLRKIPEVMVYGREVTVRIPSENAFLLGELVAIQNIPVNRIPTPPMLP